MAKVRVLWRTAPFACMKNGNEVRSFCRIYQFPGRLVYMSLIFLTLGTNSPRNVLT